MLRLRSKKSLIINLVISTLVVLLSWLVYQSRQRIVDQLTIWQFEPSSEATVLVNRAGMNDEGKFIYFASRPEIESTQDFNSVCNRVENTMSILGCFTNNRIYVYDVTDEELDGIKEVTATHEALHAVYTRLDEATKQEINGLLEAEYKKLEKDSSYKDRMDFYARTEPGERYNELHSVVGTEVAEISPKLEDYYRRYFSDRQKVVALYKKYSSVFDKLNDRALALASQLGELSESINQRVLEYNSTINSLNADIEEFNVMASNGSFETQAEFLSARRVLENRVALLDKERVAINSDIDKYNTILKEYNSNEAKSKDLYNSIDSTLAPAPSV